MMIRSLVQGRAFAAAPGRAAAAPQRPLRALTPARATNGSEGPVVYTFTSTNGNSSSTPAAAATPTPIPATPQPVAPEATTATVPAPSQPPETTPEPAPAAAAAAEPAQAAAAATGDVTATKIALLERIAGLNRGALASDVDKQIVDDLARQLESSSGSSGSSGSSDTHASPSAAEAALYGRWELLYTNVEVFRNSPFFGAFTNVVDGLAGSVKDAVNAATAGAAAAANATIEDGRLADAIFAFTDAIPNATVGTAYQVITPGSLVSEVDLAVFPGLKGTVVTTSRLAVRQAEAAAYSSGGSSSGGSASKATKVELMVESTKVERSNFSPFLDGIAVPVEQLIERARGSDAARVEYDITYLDDNLRITRCGRQLMIHRRLFKP